MTFRSLRFLLWPPLKANLPHRWAGPIILLGFCFLLCCPSGLARADEIPPPRVIILNSYHPGYTWSDEEVEGVLRELHRVYPDLSPAIEYLDTKRFLSDAHLVRVKDHLAAKYRGQKFDLVIALDNPALKMVLAHRPELFSGTPVVFTGINDFKPDMVAGQEKVTGVAEKPDIEGTLKIALALHPETTEIFVVTDGTLTGKAARKEVEAVTLRLPAGVRIEFAPPATMAELTDRIKKLPATAIILIIGFATDKAGKTFSMSEGVRHLTQDAKTPAYIVHEGRLGHGPVGGMLLGGLEEGRRAGEIAVRVLAGEDPSSVPVETKSPARPMFDYRQLARFHIPLQALPPDSLVINRPSSFLEIHKSLVWGTFGVVLALGLVVTVLSVSITRRRRAEASLRQSEERFRSLVENIDLGITLIGADYRIIMANQAQGNFFSKPANELTGQECFRVFEKRTSVCPHCPGTIAMATGARAETETQGVRDDGSQLTVRLQSFPFFGPSGQTIGFIELVEDITLIKQRERERRHHGEFLQNLLDTIPNPVFYKDLAGVYRGCNHALGELLGLAKEEIIGKTVFDLYPRDLAEKYFAMDQGLFDHPGTQVYEFDMERQDGSRGKFIFNKVTFLDPDGSLGGLIGVMTDITERNLAEEALRASEEKFRLVFEKAPIGIMLYDQTSSITDCNAKFAEIIGASKEKFLGFTLIRQLQDEKMREAVATSLRGEVGYYEGDYLSITAGKLTAVSGIFQPLFSPAGEITGGITIFEDITARKRAEMELRKSEQFFRSLFENMLNAFAYHKMIFENDKPRDYIYLEVNKAFETLTGLRNVVGKRVSEVIPGMRESDPELFVIYGRVALSGKPEKFEAYVAALKMWVSVSVYSPEKEYFVCVFDVISERKRAEEELRLKERLLDSASDSIFLHDLEGRFLYVNEAAYRTRGYTREELLDRQVSLLASPEAVMNRENILRKLRPHGELIFESEHLRRDGSVLPVEIHARMLQVGGRELILSVARDITERKQGAEALMEAAHKWRVTFDAITDAVFLMDQDCVIRQCNRALADLVQKPFAGIIGRRCWEVVHGTSRPHPDCPLARMRASKHREELLLPMGGRWYKLGVDPILEEGRQRHRCGAYRIRHHPTHGNGKVAPAPHRGIAAPELHRLQSEPLPGPE